MQPESDSRCELPTTSPTRPCLTRADLVLLCDCQEARLLVFSPAFAARQRAAMPLEPTGIRVLAPRRVRQDGTSEMVVEICEPAESPGWIFQVVLDLDLVQPEHERLPLLPEARALMLFLQSGVPWALADSGHHERSCAWWETLRPQGKPALADSFRWSFRQHFPPGAEFGHAASAGNKALDETQYSNLLKKATPSARGGRGGRGVSVDLMRTAFVGIQAGGELAMQEVNRAVEEAGARGAAAGRIDRAYIAGARVLAFGPDGKRRTIFVMKITRTDRVHRAMKRALLHRGRNKLVVKTESGPSL